MGLMLEEHVREMLGLPTEWRIYSWSCAEEDCPKGFFRLKGAVAPDCVRGKRKGAPNWRRLDRATQRIAYVSFRDHVAWLKAWEVRVGKCCWCEGEGKAAWSWSVAEGTKYRQCRRCAGSGTAPAEDTNAEIEHLCEQAEG